MGHANDLLGQFEDGKFPGIAGIYRAGEVVGGVHEANENLNEVIDVAEGSGLVALAVDGDRLILQGLDDEIGDNPTIVWVHARAVGVEDPGDFYAQAMLPVVVEKKRLGAALPFIVTGTDACRIDIAPIAFRLRVDLRVAVDLTGRGLEDLGLDPFGEAEHVDGAVDRGLGGLHRIMLVVNRRGRAGEIIDFIDLDIERKGDVVADQLKSGIAQEMADIRLGAGEKIVDAQYLMAIV